MSADQIVRIGPHIQFERKTFEQQGGGLGLFIAKRITERYTTASDFARDLLEWQSGQLRQQATTRPANVSP